MASSSGLSGKGGYVRLNLGDVEEEDQGEGGARASSSPAPFNPYISQQQAILEEQDESLDRIGSSLRSLRNVSHQIGDELEDQSEMLDELGTSMSTVEAKMNETMKKLAKLTRLEDDSRQWTAIFVLLGLVFVLLLILVVF